MEPLPFFESDGTGSPPTVISSSSLDEPTKKQHHHQQQQQQQLLSRAHTGMQYVAVDPSNTTTDYLLGRESLGLLPMIPSPEVVGLSEGKMSVDVERLTNTNTSPPVLAATLTTYSLFPRVPNVPLGRNPLQRASQRDSGSFRTSTVPCHPVTVVTAGGPTPLTTKVVSPDSPAAITYLDPMSFRSRAARDTYPGNGPLVSENSLDFSPVMWSPRRTNSLQWQVVQQESTRPLESTQTARVGHQAHERSRSDSISSPAAPLNFQAQAHIRHSYAPDQGSSSRYGMEPPIPAWPSHGHVVIQPGSAFPATHPHQVSLDTNSIAGPSSITQRPCQSQRVSIENSSTATSRTRSRYIAMLKSTDKIPRMHNILVSVFAWVLLAGFVVFPATFSWPPLGPAVLQQYCFIGLAAALVVIGVLGMAVLGVRWRNNYVWLLNRIFLPGALNGLAGLVASGSTIYAAHIHGALQTQFWTPTAMSDVCFEGAVFLVCSVLFVIYSRVLIGRMKAEYERDLEKGKDAERRGSDNPQSDAAYPMDGNVSFFNREHDQRQISSWRHTLRTPPLLPGSVV
ncbi:hypothetical protein PspLS_02668 [Pyricularia sp. CBS 133598]|nr:hypothetical protein PspLS_02668 [Pyricularia sp. CBS 133598]